MIPLEAIKTLEEAKEIMESLIKEYMETEKLQKKRYDFLWAIAKKFKLNFSVEVLGMSIDEFSGK